MKIAIVGSRDCGDHRARRIEMVDMLGHLQPSEIISGGAPGIDSIAESVAKHLGVPFRCFLAEWDKYGKRAGFIRNLDIVNALDQPDDELHAWWDGSSHGTNHTIAAAKKASKRVVVHRW